MFDTRYIKIMQFNKNFDYKNLNFFKIIQMIDNCVYELKLSQIMKKCFSIFYFLFLHFDNENSIFE